MPGQLDHQPGRSCRPGSRLRPERGAAAVEFALVAPVLVFLLLGIVEFSKVMLVQSTLSAAAREGARAVTLGGTTAVAQTAVRSAAGTVPLAAGQIVISGTCTAPTGAPAATSATTVTVTVRHTQPVLYGVLDDAGVAVTGRAAMRCGG